MSIKVITAPISDDEILAIVAEPSVEGLVVAGVREPDPLNWVCSLRNFCPGRNLPVAILHTTTELATLSLGRAAKRFREMDSRRPPRALRKHRIVVDQPGRQLVVNGLPKSLSPEELRVFLFLVRYSGVVFSREELLHRTRSSEVAVDPRIVDVLIGRLRSKIDAGKTSPSHFVTIYGIGYRFHRLGDEFIDGFTGLPFESWPCCPHAEVTTPS